MCSRSAIRTFRTRQPLRSLDLVPNNLPSQLTSFVGREPELEEVTRMLGQTHF